MTTTTITNTTTTERSPRRRGVLKLVAATIALAAAFSTAGLANDTSDAEAASLCPTIVPGFGCDVIWDDNSSFVGDTWRWLNDYFYGGGSLIEESNETIHMASRVDNRYRDCVRSFDVPSSRWMQVTDGDGDVFHLKRDTHNRLPTVHVWKNGVSLGEFWAENASFDDVYVMFETRTELVTWFGRVQQETKSVMYIVACDGSVIF